jgi:hypothetical protein
MSYKAYSKLKYSFIIIFLLIVIYYSYNKSKTDRNYEFLTDINPMNPDLYNKYLLQQINFQKTLATQEQTINNLSESVFLKLR